MKARGRALLLPFAALLPTVAPLGATAQDQQDRSRARAGPETVRVSGEVTDRSTGEAIPTVAVSFAEPTGEATVWRGVTDERGGFGSPEVPMGVYQLRADVIGYAAVRETVALTGASSVHLRVEMVPEALALEAIVVTSPRRSRLENAGFFERRAAGLGHSLTREEIREYGAARPSELFRRIPGMRVIPIEDGRANTLRYRGGCTPRLLIDGSATSTSLGIDDLLTVQDLEALEVYSAAATPAEYARGGSTCGTILAWTREPGSDEERPMSWKRLLAAATFVGLVFLVSGR